MRRRLFTFCSFISLLLCAAACVLWARSYVRFEAAGLYLPPDADGGQTFYLAQSYPHRLYVHVQTLRPYPFEPGPWGLGVTSRRVGHPSAMSRWGTIDRAAGGQLLGFSYSPRRDDPSGSYSIASASVPYWFVVAALAAPPAVWARRRLRHRRSTRAGLCPACGYDLRATPGRCPECGARPAPAI